MIDQSLISAGTYFGFPGCHQKFKIQLPLSIFFTRQQLHFAAKRLTHNQKQPQIEPLDIPAKVLFFGFLSLCSFINVAPPEVPLPLTWNRITNPSFECRHNSSYPTMLPQGSTAFFWPNPTAGNSLISSASFVQAKPALSV